MFDADMGLEVFGKSFGNNSGQPVLPCISLKEAIEQEDQEQQSKEDPQEYFKEFPQFDRFV
jgi:hypothetical protein